LAGRGLASLSVCHRWLPTIRQTSARVRPRRSPYHVGRGPRGELAALTARHDEVTTRAGPLRTIHRTAASRSPRTAGTARRPPAHPDPPAHRNQTSCRVHDATPAGRSCRPIASSLEDPSAIADERKMRARISIHELEYSLTLSGLCRRSP